jgi:hypothetical protein
MSIRLSLPDILSAPKWLDIVDILDTDDVH